MNHLQKILSYRQSTRLIAFIGTCIIMPATMNIQAAVLEEVVVTAQKREQNLQDVGISVTAYTGEQLDALGINNALDVVAHTPGLEVSGAGGGSTNSFSIRGVSQNDFAASQESAVAVYLDEAYVTLNSIVNFSLFDIDRVEVLRGPQGTLFGRNATGGLVHYITTKPSQEVDGFIDVELGEEGRRKVEGAIGGGISENVSGRLSAIYKANDGLIDNDLGPDMMEEDDYSIRGQLLFEPSEELSILLSAQYSEEDDVKGGYSHVVSYGGEYVDDPTATDYFGYRDADGDPYTASNDFDNYKFAEVLDLSVHIDWDFGRYTLTSVTNYQDIEDGYGEDADVSPFDVYNFEKTNDVEQIAQELRLSWEGERTNSVLGVYFLNIDGFYNTIQTGAIFFGPASEIASADQETTTWAVFGQTEIDITDQLSATLGIRYNNDKKDFVYQSTNIFGAAPYTLTDTFKEDDVSAKVQLNYRPNDDLLLYAGVNRGIKSGGNNFPLFPIADPTLYEFQGETLMAYEVGFKASLGDTARLNVSAYYYDYEDHQVYSFDGFATRLLNAEAESYGAEIELIANPTEGLDIMLGLAVNDNEITDVPLAGSDGTEKAVLTPSLSLNGLIRYSWPALNGSLAAQLDGTWKDDHNFNLTVTPVIQEKAFGLINARLSYTTSDEKWSGSIFVRNLTDEYYRTYSFDTGAFFGSLEDIPGIQRWVGGSVAYHW